LYYFLSLSIPFYTCTIYTYTHKHIPTHTHPSLTLSFLNSPCLSLSSPPSSPFLLLQLSILATTPVPVTRKRKAKTATPAAASKKKATATKKRAVVTKKVTKKEEKQVPVAAADSDDESDFSGLESDVEDDTAVFHDTIDGDANESEDDKPKSELSSEQQKKKDIIRMARKRRGVVYIGHLPYGFHESQMRNFFAQFGRITRLKMARSPKSRAARHYGFIEFADREVAKIVAKAMNNYMMFGHTLKCEFIPANRVHRNTFLNSAKTPAFPAQKVAAMLYNGPRTAAQQKRRQQRSQARRNKVSRKLAEMGIKYDLQPYSETAAPEQKAQPVVESESEEEEAPAPVPAPKVTKKKTKARAKTPRKTPARKTAPRKTAQSARKTRTTRRS
jgi:nucleolar protein 15